MAFTYFFMGTDIEFICQTLLLSSGINQLPLPFSRKNYLPLFRTRKNAAYILFDS